MRVAPRYGAIAPAVLLFLLTLRRSGERAGRLAGRLETSEKVNDIQRQMLDAAARRPRDRSNLADCLRDGHFRAPHGTVCPPFVEHSREVQAHAADELDLLPDGSAITKLFSESVLRDQALAGCQ